MTAPPGLTATPVSEDALRRSFGQFATGVTVVSARDTGGAPLGITMNSFSSVSLDPPLILFCLGRNANNFEDFRAASAFAVSVLGRHQEDLSARFASSAPDPWVGVPWEAGQCGAPLLRDRIAALECLPHGQYDGGDHVIFVARVTCLHPGNGGRPLVYWRSQYRGVDGP